METGSFLRLAIPMVAALGKGPSARSHAQGYQTSKFPGDRTNGRRAAHWLRLRVAPARRTAASGHARVDRRHSDVHGPRADRAHEPSDRLPTRPVFTGYHFLPDAHRLASFAASDSMEWVHCHVARKPAPPNERLENVPAAVSGIIMKLLSKMAEECYQTAAGVERDLRRCHAEWELRRSIDDFTLGQHDTPDRLLVPDNLYGRACDIEMLIASFDRIVRSGVRSWCWSRDIPVSEIFGQSMNCTRCWCRRAGSKDSEKGLARVRRD
jgi:hypothetical protein